MTTQQVTKRLSEPFNIGKIELKNRVLLAPLASVADRAFRELCREKGASLSCSEMISAKGVHYKSDKSLELDDHGPIESPFAVQLFGRDPDIMAEAAEKFVERGADIIDINMGCPVRKVTSNGEGSALMNEPSLAADIVSAIVRRVNVPVTVKIRRGYVTGDETAPAVASMLEQAGASAIAVHGRFRDALYSGKSDPGVISRVKASVSIPVIGNGDIRSAEDAGRMLEATGCDAVMIGRGALGNPWIFSELLGAPPFIKSAAPDEFLRMIERHYAAEIAYKGEDTAVLEMRTHLSWYLKGLRGSASLRDAVCRETDVSKILTLIKNCIGQNK